MKAIGGYFELELSSKNEYHSVALKLNSGRAAFEYILRIRGYKKVYMPYYTCDTIFEPIQRLKLDHEFYFIDAKMEPIFDFSKIREDEALLYTNYFGLKDMFIRRMTENHPNIIIDNVPAFFSMPIQGYDCFYSPRKFFGVPDGGYLYPDRAKYKPISLKRDISYKRSKHLLKRIDVSPEEGYRDFITSNEDLCFVGPQRMSKLTETILRSIDYADVVKTRKRNFAFLHKSLEWINELDFSDVDFETAVPIVYPLFLPNEDNLRAKLINEKIYVAQYWPNVLDWTNEDSTEHTFTQKIIAIPIDQRYALSDMRRIVLTLNNILEVK